VARGAHAHKGHEDLTSFPAFLRIVTGGFLEQSAQLNPMATEDEGGARCGGLEPKTSHDTSGRQHASTCGDGQPRTEECRFSGTKRPVQRAGKLRVRCFRIEPHAFHDVRGPRHSLSFNLSGRNPAGGRALIAVSATPKP